MRRLLAGFALLSVLTSVAEERAEACGDKLLALARGIRLQRAYIATHSGPILIYSGGSGAAKTVKEGALASSLAHAGHKVQLVGNADQLDRMLRSGRFDLLLVDVGVAAAMAELAATLDYKPLVLPVLFKPTQAELSSAEKRFRFLLRAPFQTTQHLQAVDSAIKSRSPAARS